jgi:hypothetical protein
MTTLRTLTAIRYVVPLREGGSLPAVVEVSDGNSTELVVVKFKGAGQGAKALIAELVVGLMARHLELPVPELALVRMDSSFGRTERDPEIQDILKGSVGLNVGMLYLDGAFNYNPVSNSDFISSRLAADIVWLDAFTTNIDRTARNPNLMIHDRRPWLIDHGAALFFHHDWPSVNDQKSIQPFAQIADHVLLSRAGDIAEADTRLSERLSSDAIRSIVGSVPEELLMHAPEGTSPAFANARANREAYVSYLTSRLNGERHFVIEAVKAQVARRNELPRMPSYRR